jgi:hypothetical protein
MIKQAFAIVLGWAAFAHPAQAAKLFSSGPHERTMVITLTGEIEPGDADALKSLIKAAKDNRLPLSGMRLKSNGGELREAFILAALVRDANLSTAVAQGDECASACAIVFAAGVGKLAEHGARIGLHGATDASGKEDMESEATTLRVARLLSRLDVPPDIIGKMVVTPVNQMLWLTPDDLRSMDVAMIGKPALRGREQGAQSLSRIEPSTRARPQVAWDDLLAEAVAAAAEQNKGRAPMPMRQCDRQDNNCWYGVMVRGQDDQGDMLVRRMVDGADKTLHREFCQFSARGDIRACLDWDTNVTSRQIKDRHGKWRNIADELLPGGW